MGGEPVEAEKMYKLATNDLAVGGDEYHVQRQYYVGRVFSAERNTRILYPELGVVNVQTEGRITIKEEPVRT